MIFGAIPSFFAAADNFRRTMAAPRQTVWRPYGSVEAASFAPVATAGPDWRETKYFDTAYASSVAMTTSWTGSELTMTSFTNSGGAPASYTDSCIIPSANGTGYGQVVGSRYALKKIRYRFASSLVPTTGGTVLSASPVLRICLVMDTAPNGVQAQGEDIMSQGISANSVSALGFQRVYESSGRFKILRDHFVDLPRESENNATASSVSTASSSYVHNGIWAPKEPILVNLQPSDTNSVANVRNVNIFFLVKVYVPQSDSATVRVEGVNRVYYCDT